MRASARVARFYGWSDDALRTMAWRRVLAYMYEADQLEAEEYNIWLMIEHGEPKQTQAMLRSLLAEPAKGSETEPELKTRKPEQDAALAGLMLNPYTRSRIAVVEKLPDPRTLKLTA